MPQSAFEQRSVVTTADAHATSASSVALARRLTLQQVWRHTVRAMLRSAVYAALARWGFGIIKSIVKAGIGKRFLAAAAAEVFSTNPLKWAVVAGGLSSFRGIQQTLERLLGLPHGVSGFTAGALASLSVLVMNVQTRTELSLYLGARAAHGACTSLLLPNLPEKLRDFEHWDVVTMSLCAWQILYGLMFMPHCHQPSYQAFLYRCTLVDPRVVESVAGMHRNHMIPNLVAVCAERKLPVPALCTATSCMLFHPNQNSCGRFLGGWFLQHLTRLTLPLYLPLKVTTTLLFSRQKVLVSPLPTLQKIVVSAVRSAVFLTAYCASPVGFMCVFSKAGIRSPWLLACAGGLLPGVATLIEPKSRRLDLALYCVMHAFRCAVLTLVARGHLRRPTRHHVTALLMAAVGFLHHQYDTEPHGMHPNMRSAVAWLGKETAKKPAKPAVLAEAAQAVPQTPMSAVVPQSPIVLPPETPATLHDNIERVAERISDEVERRRR